MFAALAVLVVILVVAYWAYSKCKLNKYIPAKFQKKCSPPGGGFVGAMAHSPALVPCRFPGPAGAGAWQLNRCNYA